MNLNKLTETLNYSVILDGVVDERFSHLALALEAQEALQEANPDATVEVMVRVD